MRIFLINTVMAATSSMTPAVTTGKILLVFSFIREFVSTVTPNNNLTTEKPTDKMVNQSSNVMYYMMTLITFPADITCDIAKVRKLPIYTVHESYVNNHTDN